MTTAPLSRSQPSRGIVLMLGGLVCFTLMDAVAKFLTGQYPPLQVVWARYAGQMLLLTLVFAPRLATVLRTRALPLQVGRSILQFGATGLFFLALPHIGLAEATAIMDVNPVLITLGAALFLGERLGPRRAAGIAVALIGAMIVIRPGSGVFSVAALLPLGAACCYAGFALLTRAAGGRDGAATSLFYAAMVGTAVTTAMLPALWQPVAAAHAAAFAGLGLLGAAGQFFMIRAFTVAEAGAIAPFGYLGLILAALWGWVFFDAVPDRWTVLGALVIVGAGLYVWRREARAARG